MEARFRCGAYAVVRCMTARSAPGQLQRSERRDAARSQSHPRRFDGRIRIQPRCTPDNAHRGRGQLDPAQCLRARKEKACPVSAASWVNSPGRGVRRCDLPRGISTSASKAKRPRERSGSSGASRSCRTDDAVEHSAGVHPLLDPHQRSGLRRSQTKSSPSGSMDSERFALEIHDRRATA